MRSSSSFALCGSCEEDPNSLLTLENILQSQKFGDFIVLCSFTHLVAALTYAPHSFLLLLSLVVLKFLTALLSLSTAVTLLPQLLRLFVVDGFLRQKARDLGRMRRQEAATCRVRLLTTEIRRSLDRRTILDTALAHLADALSRHDCAIWMPTSPDSLSLTHHLNRRRLDRHQPHHHTVSISTADSDVAEIITRKELSILDPNSNLVRATESDPVGPVAAIRNVGMGMVALTFEVFRTGFAKEDKISNLKESEDDVGDRQISFFYCRKLAEVSFSVPVLQ